MKVLIVSNPNSSHTLKWVTSLEENGVDVVLFAIHDIDPNIRKEYNETTIINAGVKNNYQNLSEVDFLKLIYLRSVWSLKNLISSFKPDILHAHYASSFGLLGALTGFHPLFISAWGTDILSFPQKSKLHRFIIKYNCRKANKILATSQFLAGETEKFTNKKVSVIPFGVDIVKFQQQKVNSLFADSDIVIGIVKKLEEVYGIEFLIKAFKIISKKYKNLSLKLLLVGAGVQEKYLKTLVQNLGLNDKILFTGYIPPSEVPRYHNMMDIEVYLSNYESFGVSVVEASACEKPVVVSNVGGLPEVVDDNKTGFIVLPGDPQRTADAIEKLILDKDLRIKFGKAGREKVERFYNWDKNINDMIRLYDRILNMNKN